MSNLIIYEAVRTVPEKAKKPIEAGRLKGKTDINPMWRIRALTDLFGPCGIGWKYVITKQWLEHGANNEIAAFVNIDLFIKHNGEWSDSIPGTGGSAFVSSERNGLYVSDECFKMALTDAISVSCKALGFGADVYWEKDSTKYDNSASGTNEKNATKTLSSAQLGRMYVIAKAKGASQEAVDKAILKSFSCTPEAMTKAQYDKVVAGYESVGTK